MTSNWKKIIIMRYVEALLSAAALGIGIWHTVKSKKLEEELDSQFDDFEDDETTE